MFRFIETIRIEDSQIFLADLHQARMDCVFSHYGKENPHLIKDYFVQQNHNEHGLYKWRIIYDLDGSISCLMVPYAVEIHNNFELVNGDHLEYSFKYENRDNINKLKASADAEAVIFYQNGMITDTSYSNLIFRKDNEWYTPETFLLNGVMRQHLLKSGKIKPLEISLKNIKEFSHFQMINAMIPFNTQEYPIALIQNLYSIRSLEI
ncbi:aminodeoxychorismate lyase [Elizabethkingia anophelis]|uniref:aminotransferase class IV n=1 Tax=Elizabethkingia anophelis TaxID=1117645 RepID=UPI0020115046|nr:aminotransferase class IV [Elizabethkingia anophelis]MCL1690921.1 aminotransferase class IV [Elizabethkingia anophelis]MDV3572979.1 aminodeoxychorismate lyase [Elizabethkingia anophelis]MDV3598462.1 aminodeoxychorismate lyase [Elizabethkingia anophelis]MDV3605481.1 aminodeoxychorismate lyase [Elizabethkingia anophelis]MDV3638159.1 aminodeoxychorismate lyase [Elizabethkingia anophelis]